MRTALPRVALLVGAFLLSLHGCANRKGDVGKPPGTTCEETRDSCLAKCKEDCEQRTYCEEGDSPELDACVSTCQDNYPACIL